MPVGVAETMIMAARYIGLVPFDQDLLPGIHPSASADR